MDKRDARILQLENFIIIQGLELPEDVVYDIAELTESNIALLPMGDIRVNDNGMLVVHPQSSNSERKYMFGKDAIKVQKVWNGLKIIVPDTDTESSTFPVYSFICKGLDKVWNRIVDIETEV